MKSGQIIPATVLVIDRDPLTLTGIGAAMDIAGFECHGARGAEAALKAVRNLPLDVIICDIDLRPDNGIELFHELQQEPNMSEVPWIFLSSQDEDRDRVLELRQSGGLFFLRKPFDPEVLVTLVDKSLWMPHLVRSHVKHSRSDNVHAPRAKGFRQDQQDVQDADQVSI